MSSGGGGNGAIPQIRFYIDDRLNGQYLDRLNELWSLFKDDNPKWITRQECLNLKTNLDSYLFVFSLFDGPAFEYLKNSKARLLFKYFFN